MAFIAAKQVSASSVPLHGDVDISAVSASRSAGGEPVPLTSLRHSFSTSTSPPPASTVQRQHPRRADCSIPIDSMIMTISLAVVATFSREIRGIGAPQALQSRYADPESACRSRNSRPKLPLRVLLSMI